MYTCCYLHCLRQLARHAGADVNAVDAEDAEVTGGLNRQVPAAHQVDPLWPYTCDLKILEHQRNESLNFGDVTNNYQCQKLN